MTTGVAVRPKAHGIDRIVEIGRSASSRLHLMPVLISCAIPGAPARNVCGLRSPAGSLATAVMMATDLSMLYLMFNKPDLLPSLVLLLGANALAIVVNVVRQRSANAALPTVVRTVA